MSLCYEEMKKHYLENGSEFYEHLFESVESNIDIGDASIICCPQNMYIDSDEKHLTLYFFMENRLIRFTRPDSQTVVLNSVRYKDFIDVVLTQTSCHIMLEIRTSAGVKFHLYSDSTTVEHMEELGRQLKDAARLII